MKIASYNVKALKHIKDADAVAEVLKNLDADVVGLQEVDCFTERGGSVNQVEWLAEKAGYSYWYFCKTINYRGGGYGHGVLSRYPIKQSEGVNYEVIGERDRDGNRNYERHVIDVNGKELVFYNTHLTLDAAAQAKELEQVYASMAKDSASVLTGDMNALPELVESVLDKEKFASLNKGILTYPEMDKSRVAIDHMVVSRNILKDESITVVKAAASDHNPIFAEIEL